MKQENEGERKNTVVRNSAVGSYLPLTKQKGNRAKSNTFSFEFPLPQQHPFSTPPAVLWRF
jgi:hypothetical protein